MLAELALKKVLTMDFHTVLDIGSGKGEHAHQFERNDRDVTTIDLKGPATYIRDYMDTILPVDYDCIWASHVLEHQENVGMFLYKCWEDLKEGGILAITVPPAKDAIVGGHLTIWNAGLLLYNLIIAGLDCSQASVKTYGYNISVVVKKKTIQHYPKLNLDRDKGDIEKLAHFFPMEVKQGFDGNINEINWK